MNKRWFRLTLLLAFVCLLGLPSLASAQGRFALVIEGASGEEQYAKMHREWLTQLVGVLRDKFKFDPASLTVLAETPASGEQVANAVNVRAVLDKLAKQLKPTDTLFVMLIGHGSGSGGDAKFNLVGPDLTVNEWNAQLKPITARIAFVDATSASSPFLQGLAGPNRIVVTATNTPAQVYHPFFGSAFIEALTSAPADLVKNDRVSLWEAFVYASRLVQQHYERAGQLSVEHAMLDDNGDGVGRDASGAGTDGTLSSMTYLDAAPAAASADPAVQALIQRRDQLAMEVDKLRQQRSTMPAAEFDQAFEKLIVDLALVSRDVRRAGIK
jgi:hypothetical protein